MNTKQFIFKNLRVFYKHTDFYGFVHPYNFYEWTSYVREAYFQETVSNFAEVSSRPIKMMTTKIGLKILGEALFSDFLEAKLSVGKIKKVSFDMFVRFFNLRTQQVISRTHHTVVFVDSVAGGFAPIPKEMMNVIVHYQEEGGDIPLRPSVG